MFALVFSHRNSLCGANLFVPLFIFGIQMAVCKLIWMRFNYCVKLRIRERRFMEGMKAEPLNGAYNLDTLLPPTWMQKGRSSNFVVNLIMLIFDLDIDIERSLELRSNIEGIKVLSLHVLRSCWANWKQQQIMAQFSSLISLALGPFFITWSEILLVEPLTVLSWGWIINSLASVNFHRLFATKISPF